MELQAQKINKTYKGRKVVNDVSLSLKKGEIVGLLGPNGAGKTTSFYMIVGLIKPDSGRVFLHQKEVSVFRKLSVEDNIKAILEMTGLSKDQQRNKLESLIEEFGLGHVRKTMGIKLSGGEKRRTEIARCLANEPDFILLDEPFAGVDPIAVEDIQRIVLKLREKKIGILITDHNVQETLSIVDRAYLLFEGAILKSGSAEDLAADEQVRKVYLGQNFKLQKKTKGF